MLDHWSDYLLLALAAAGALAAVGTAVWYRGCVVRLERLLDRFAGEKPEEERTLEDTRESKLESRMHQLLGRARRDREQASRERDDVAALLSDLSHQLKTPLANVLMYTELLADETLSGEERRSFVQEAGGQTRKMQWLLREMLKASRLEQGIISFSAGYCGIKETLGKAVGAVYAQAQDKQISVVTEEFEDRKLWHNPQWTVEALGNILDNAVKYAPEHSQITVRVRPLEIYTRIEIEDQGPGIDSAEYNEIFKRFYRGRQEQQEGSGLGLYLTQLILNREKGYVTVSSRKGEGSCFSVYLLN